MSQAGQSLAEVLRGAEHVLLDFDGPLCSVFAGLSATEVTTRMLQRLPAAGHTVGEGWESETDPLALLRRISREAPGAVADADAILAELETDAVQRATPNPEAGRLLDACAETSRAVHIVSNNAGQAITSYLARHSLISQVRQVVGRVPGDPSSMKPSPRLLLDAMGVGASEPKGYVFVGDAVRDVEAGHAAGIPTIGYANKPGKDRALAEAGAVAVVSSLLPIAQGLSPAGG
jgi:phosphoglycolate phosphatase-like HAD superfamily hydrolase